MSGALRRWPPIRDQCLIARHQQQQQHQHQRKKQQLPPPLDETPLIKAIVEHIKSYETSITDIPDIAIKIKKLKDYTFVSPLMNAIAEVSSSHSLNLAKDIDAIKTLYKEIDLIVWTYEFYTNHITQSNDGSAKSGTSSLSLSLPLLSYPDFVNYIFESVIVPTIRHINAMNHSRADSGIDVDDDIIPKTNTIMDLILCGTDIPIPTSIYDLPKVLYDALHQTKYPPSNDTAEDASSSISSNLSLVYMNRNQQLRNNDEHPTKMHLEENKRYNMLYIYLLAHVAIHISNNDNDEPSNNNNSDMSSLSNDPSTRLLLNWKNTLTEISKCHPFSSLQSLTYMIPIIIAIVQLDWYSHRTTTTSSSWNTSQHDGKTLWNNKNNSFPFRRYALNVSLKLIVSDLLKEEYFNILEETTHFHTYVIQSVLCEHLLHLSEDCTKPATDDPNEISVCSACHKLMTYRFSLQSSYYQSILVSLYKKQSKMNNLQRFANDNANIPPLCTEDTRTNAVLPTFCVKNDYPYKVHVLIFCHYGSQYHRAVQLVRSLCSGFMEQEMTQSIGSNNSGDIFVDISKIDIEIVSNDDIISLYESIFVHMLSNDYRIIFYNRDYYNYVYNFRIDHTIDFIIQIATPPSWNYRYHNTPIEVFAHVLQTFRNDVLDCTAVNNEVKYYIDLICQQVLLRIVFQKYNRYITYIPSEFCRHLLPQNLLSILPSEVLSQLPTNQEYHHASEPTYISIINNGIKRLISDEIAFPVSWFGDIKPKRLGKKLSPEHDAQLDIYWTEIHENVYGSVAESMDVKVDRNASIASTSATSEETTRFVAYALSKMTKEVHGISTTDGSMKALTGSNVDGDTAMEPPEGAFTNEDQYMSDVDMDDAQECTTSDDQLISRPTDESASVRQNLPQKQQLTTPTHDIDSENDAVMFYHDDTNVNQYTSDGDNVYSETEEGDDVDDDVEAEIYEGEDADEVYEEEDTEEDNDQQCQQQHIMGSSQDEAIDVDDDDDESNADAEDSDDYSTNDNENRDDRQLDVSTETEMEVDNAAESNDDDDDDDDDDSDCRDNEAVAETIDSGVDIESTFPQKVHMKGNVQHDAPPTENGKRIETMDVASQNDQIKAEGKEYIEDSVDGVEMEYGDNDADEEHIQIPKEPGHDEENIEFIAPDSFNADKISDGTVKNNEIGAGGQGIDIDDSVDEVEVDGGDNDDSNANVQRIDIDDGVVDEKPDDGDNDSVQEENACPNNPVEDVDREMLPTDELDSNAATNIKQNYDCSASTPGQMDVGDGAVGKDVDVENGGGTGEKNVSQHEQQSALHILPADISCNDSTNLSYKQDDEFNAEPKAIGLPAKKEVEIQSGVTHDSSIIDSTKSFGINEIVPLDSTTKSDVNSLRLPNNDSEAGYDAEDSQDAATDDDDNEFHHDSMTRDDVVLHGNNFSTSTLSAATQAASSDPLLVDRKAVSTLIDKGYEPDTQEGPTDVDFIHHIDPEAGYEAEDSQDAGTEEENDDHHPNKGATMEPPMSLPTITTVEASASSNALTTHHENVSKLIDQGYEPDPESQGQTDVDGVPQQTRHMESSGYDGEESQCHTEDDIHTEDERQILQSGRSLPDGLQHHSASERLQHQFIRPTASADGMIADDEMEEESSEVEMADGGSKKLQIPQQETNAPLSENKQAGNLLTQIATSIQNEHSYDSPKKKRSIDVPNTLNDATVQMNEYIPHIDGGDEDDDESSDSVRSKPGDEISCPMSDTHSSQSSIGMRSAAKSTASGALSQPNPEVVPISEIQTKMNLELPKLKGKKMTAKVKRPTKSLHAPAKRILRTGKTAGTKETNDKLSPIMTRKRKATMQPGQTSIAGSDNTSTMAAKNQKRSRGRPPKPPTNIPDSKNEPLPEKRSTRSTTAGATAVGDTQSIASSCVSKKESPAVKRSTRSTTKTASVSVAEDNQRSALSVIPHRRKLRSSTDVQNDASDGSVVPSSVTERRTRSRNAASPSSSVAVSSKKSKKANK